MTILLGLAMLVASPIAADTTTVAQDIAMGRTTSVAAVKRYLKRIDAIDRKGPKLNAVIAVMPDALKQAKRLDKERREIGPRGPLHGVPILIKDNIEVAGPLPTTAGSLALADNVTNRDAPLVARLRAAGAVILGKTNLSEWANIRSNKPTSGWSAVGGLTRNPHVLDRNACGSSSGSGAAMAAELAAATVGTETDGSITCPAGVNGVVGFKPSVGLVSRTNVVPISASQDTAGPMTASVRDAALMLTAMAGSDPADPVTADADRHKQDYTAALSPDGLKGLRVGVLRDRIGSDRAILALFEAALSAMKQQGAVIIDIKDSRKGLEALGEAEFTVLLYELKAGMAAYLGGRPAPGSLRTLADVIAFNKTNAATELRWFGQEIFEQAEKKGGLNSAEYRKALITSRRLAREAGIDRLLREHRVELLIGITNGPAWTSDLVNGDNFGGPSVSQLSAVAGYPHLTVPMGAVHGLPIGLSIIGRQWHDARVLAAGHAYEQASRLRVRPAYLQTITDGRR